MWSIDDVWGFRVGKHSSADWIFYFPWHRHQIEGTNGFYCIIRKTLASGVNGIAKVPKRKEFTEVGLEPSNVRSPVNALPHSATAPHMVWPGHTANYQAVMAPSSAFVGKGDNVRVLPTTPYNGQTRPCQTYW